MPMRILVADDSVTIQKVVELAFAQRGARVFTAGDGEEAAARVREVDPDIMLLDVVMPGPDGYALCEEIKRSESSSWVPVVLLAGSFEPFDEARARAAGADGNIRKPFQTRDLVDLVDRLTASHPRPGGVEEEEEEPAPPPAPEVPPAPRVEAEAPAAPVAQPDRDLAADRGDARAPRRESEVAAASPGAEPVDGETRAAVRELAESIVREIAWEVIPDLAEAIIRKRIRELEDAVDRREET